jgi:hypothetical protein
MAGTIASAAPSVVMPYSLAIAFRQQREYVNDENRYMAGEVQRSALVTTSRKTWTITKNLTNAQVAALRTFYLAQQGGLIEFWFYDVFETSPKFSYDMTGAASAGRYAARFDGILPLTLQLARHQVQLTIKEVN